MSVKFVGTVRSCVKLTFHSTKNKNFILFPQITSFSTSHPRQLREIVKEEKAGTLVIQGKIVDSPKAKSLIKIPGDQAQACPICRLNLDIKYTDVLILAQFLHKNGELLPREVTGLCIKSQNKILKLVSQAHRAGLLPTFKKDIGRPRALMSKFKWKQFPAYFKDVY